MITTCALIGLGYWGNIIKQYIEKNPNLHLKTIYSFDLPNTTLEAILSDTDVKVVFICTPISTHYEITKKCLLAKKHVFCEKPLSANIEEVDELIALAKIQNVCLYTDYIYVNSPSLKKLKEHLPVNTKNCYIRANIEQFGRFYDGDNVFEVLGVHMISALMFLFSTEKNTFKINHIKTLRNTVQKITTDGIIYFQLPQNIKGEIYCSLTSIHKRRSIEIVSEDNIYYFDMMASDTLQILPISYDGNFTFYHHAPIIYTYDENNNLKYALEDFIFCVHSQNCLNNMNLSTGVTIALEQIKSII